MAEPSDLNRVAAFYRAAGYSVGARAEDRVVIAEADGELIGAVRLVREEGVIVLRGMRVSPGWQRRGVGARLLDGVAASLADGPCHCIAYPHLVAFYGRIGFVEAAPAEAPPFLRSRLEDYRAHRPEAFCLLFRPGGSGG
jgi:predicted N-acetyltransferase YhbS